MEILIGIWVLSGIITYTIVLINGDEEFEGFGFFLSLLIGPLILLWMAGSMLFEYINSSHQHKVSKPQRSVPPSKSLEETFSEIEAVFSSSNAKLLKRGDIANLQRFA